MDIGREVARNDSHEPGKHSRLWLPKDIYDVIKNRKGTEAIEELTSIKRLHLGGCSPSLLAYTFTQSVFQKYSGFGHQILICIALAEFPDWISQSNDLGTTVTLNLASNVLHTFLGIILCFKHRDNNSHRIHYSLRNTISGSVWSHNLYTLDHNESWMVIVPRSLCPVNIDGYNRIELRTKNADVLGYHLLHSTTVTVEDERSCPSKRLKHLESDEKSYPSKRSKHLESDD
ncbi:hypothetical protein POM88_020115 [Heracleum sosnowskyi]|uniref:Uncharacterized protein n=1 Tax=Heracleum sosnowskyi TaxID=360622 RepID=A0AAD8MMS6_9APIA|nr:hypothetical protein POM88_020115 [Heracleum sosnowskyi]